MEKLRNLIDEIIVEYRKDMKFIQRMRKAFSIKGLDSNIPAMLFKNQMELSELDINELICITDFLHTELEQSRFDLKKYFSDMEINNYILYQQQNKSNNQSNIKIVHLKEVRKVSDTEYIVPMTAKQLTELRQNRQFAYFKDIQRCSKKVKLPNGEVIEKINVNKEGIENLKARFKSKERYIVPTEISLTILDIVNKNPQYQFIPKYKNTGDLNIKVNFDIDSSEYTPLIINDGYHRTMALTDSYLEDKTIENVPLIVGIHVLTEVQAKDLTADTFEQNATDKQWVDSLKLTQENKMVDILIEKSSILSEYKIENNKKEFVKNKKAITYKVLLKQTLKALNIKFKNDISMTRTITKMAKNLDLLLHYLKDEHEQLFNRDNLLCEKAFVLYLAIVNNLKEDIFLIGEIADKIALLNITTINTQTEIEIIKIANELKAGK